MMVMVVEDDPALRDTVLEVLEDEGFTSVGAENGREALHILCDEHVHPGLILLDLMMPVMNGWQFRERQLGASDPEIASIPVVVMSAMDATNIRADAVIQKPFRVEALLETIAGVARSHRPSSGGAPSS